MTRDCQRAVEVAAVVASGEWSRAGSSELRLHAASCPACADLVLVMSAIGEARDAARRTAVVPSAGLVWWKAHLRKRQEATRRAEAPVAAVQLISLLVILTAAVFLVWMAGSLSLVGVDAVAFDLSALTSWFTASAAAGNGASSLVRYTLMLGASASLIFAAAALYLALRSD
jgi:hypothetical protein